MVSVTANLRRHILADTFAQHCQTGINIILLYRVMISIIAGYSDQKESNMCSNNSRTILYVCVDTLGGF